ncbi:MAG TPA: hypothetical protein VIX91_03685, partial [Candidatus Acidoferrum sp.]
ESAQVQVVTLNGTDVGWLQTARTEDSLFLAQLHLEAPVHRQGIGTEVMRRLIREAGSIGQAVTLG